VAGGVASGAGSSGAGDGVTVGRLRLAASVRGYWRIDSMKPHLLSGSDYRGGGRVLDTSLQESFFGDVVLAHPDKRWARLLVLLRQKFAASRSPAVWRSKGTPRRPRAR
jgi:hypothetical protein